MKLLIFISLIFLINYFLKKKNYLSNNTGQLHQKYSEKNFVPLSGGIFLIIFFSYDLFRNESLLLISLYILFIIGILADLDVIRSPSKRIILQVIFVIFFIIFSELKISDLRIEFLNYLLENEFINILFTSFCLLILINGSNFIDGNNGLSLGYFLVIFLILLNLNNNHDINNYEIEFIRKFIIILSILLILNLCNLFYLGDSGIYLLSFITGYILIHTVHLNSNLSPFFIAVLLWYPAFELLFSMIRKMKYRYSPMKPDINHLHQLIFINLSNKFDFSSKLVNSLTGISINIFNLFSLYMSSLFTSSTKIQIFILLLNVLAYSVIYMFLVKRKKLLEL